MNDLDRSAGAEAAATAMAEAVRIEAEAATGFWRANGERLKQAVDVLSGASGRVVVCGLGKSGHIGRKMSASLASLGTPSFFLHATEALHGDFGMCTSDDAALLISYSGETVEVVKVATMMKSLGMPTVAITGGASSSLARTCDAVIDIAVEREADPLNLAPTTSALLTLMAGDAIAVGMQSRLDFGPQDFALRHPGGSLGVQLNGGSR